MKRYYFVTDNLPQLLAVEESLKQEGITPLQMHLLSDEDAELERHGLQSQNVDSLFRNDITRSLLSGFIVGLCAVALILGLGYALDTDGAVNWWLLVLFSLIALGFCTWEGGMLGIHRPNRRFKKFVNYLRSGKHLFFVDIHPGQEAIVERVAHDHRHLQPMGTDAGEADFAHSLRVSFRRWLSSAP